MEENTRVQKDTTSNMFKIKITAIMLVTAILITSVVLIVKFSKSKTRTSNSAANTPASTSKSTTSSGSGTSSGEVDKTTKPKPGSAASVSEHGKEGKKGKEETLVHSIDGSDSGGGDKTTKAENKKLKEVIERLTKLEEAQRNKYSAIEKDISLLKKTKIKVNSESKKIEQTILSLNESIKPESSALEGKTQLLYGLIRPLYIHGVLNLNKVPVNSEFHEFMKINEYKSATVVESFLCEFDPENINQEIITDKMVKQLILNASTKNGGVDFESEMRNQILLVYINHLENRYLQSFNDNIKRKIIQTNNDIENPGKYINVTKAEEKELGCYGINVKTWMESLKDSIGNDLFSELQIVITNCKDLFKKFGLINENMNLKTLKEKKNTKWEPLMNVSVTTFNNLKATGILFLENKIKPLIKEINNFETYLKNNIKDLDTNKFSVDDEIKNEINKIKLKDINNINIKDGRVLGRFIETLNNTIKTPDKKKELTHKSFDVKLRNKGNTQETEKEDIKEDTIEANEQIWENFVLKERGRKVKSVPRKQKTTFLILNETQSIRGLIEQLTQIKTDFDELRKKRKLKSELEKSKQRLSSESLTSYNFISELSLVFYDKSEVQKEIDDMLEKLEQNIDEKIAIKKEIKTLTKFINAEDQIIESIKTKSNTIYGKLNKSLKKDTSKETEHSVNSIYSHILDILKEDQGFHVNDVYEQLFPIPDEDDE